MVDQPNAHSNHSLSPGRAKELFGHGGEMGALMGSIDWEKTPLGPVENWPQSLQTAVSICLLSRFPILIWWGSEYIKIYNDAYRPLLGTTKHPKAMGQRGQECWREIWDIIGPMLDSVYHNGQSTWSENQMLPLERNGYTEECYFTFSYSPIYDETGGIGGIFTVVHETTKRVVGERRLQTLRELGKRANEGQSAADACRIASEVLALNIADIPFSQFYLMDKHRTTAHLVAYSGFEASKIAAYLEVALGESDSLIWPLATVSTTAKPMIISDLAAHFSALPVGLWHETPTTALVLPISSSGENEVIGYLISGVSPRLALDDDYRGFYDLVVGQVGAAIANAVAYESERKRVEALIQLDKAKTEFFSNISHEFRTPLTLIINPLQDLIGSGLDGFTPDQRENMLVMYRNSRRLLKLVNTLLDYSRIQSDRIQSLFEATDLAILTADLASTFRSAVNRAGIRFHVDCPPLRVPVYVDRDMWEKIVLNLLSNAFKFTFEGEISVTLHAAEAVAQLTVRDTGVGIASDELPHVFERFHRAYASRSRSKEGSGIGLALVQELVRFHHGEITVESTPTVGTTFIVSIPLGTAHLPPDKLKTTATMVSGALGAAPYVEEVLNWLPAVNSPVPVGASLEFTGNDTIPRIDQPVTDYVLVVDDNPDMGAYIRRLLQERFIVELVTDGQQALSRVENRLPGLILSDIMMPNLDGLQLLHQIRANPMAKSTPFIVLSARAGDEARTKALQEGADDYIIKPFTAGELVARIETHLKIARLRKERLDQERQLRLRTEQILESISDAFYTVDSDWRFIYVNQKAADLWNKERSALIGQNIWEALPLAYGNETYVALHEAVAEQKPRRFETFGPYTHTWFTVTAFPTPTELSVYFSEITEQKRIENFQRFLINAGVALSSSLDYEETFQKVANLAIPDLADGCIIESVDENHVLQLIANAHVDPAKVEVISDLRQRYPISLEQDGYSAALAHQKSQLMSEMSNGEYGLSNEHRRQLQRYEALGVRSFILVPIIGVDKVSVLGAITFIISETDRHYQADDLLLVEELARRAAVAIENSKLYREAQDQRQRFQVTLASIGDAVIATDVNSRITFMNNSAETLTGWSVADAIDRDLSQIFQIVGERSRTRVENPVASVLQQRKTVGLANHTILIAKDGTEHFIDHSAAPIKDQNGDILGVILIFRDITQRRYTENILENTLIRTQDLYHVSHQIGLANSSRGVLQALFQSETLRSVNQAAIITFSNSMPVDPEMIAATPYEIAAAIPEQLRLPGLLGQPQLVNEPLVELFLSAKKPVYIADIGLHDTISESLRGLFYESDVKSIALIPLQANEAWIGLLLLYCQHRHSWTADDIRQLQIFSEQISVAIRNIQLLVTEEAARREAEKANQIKMEFLGMISHELRTPLAVIKGFTSTILSTDVTWDAQNQQNFIAIIDEETNKLTDLVAQLLELSQLTAGRLRVHIAPHPVQDIVNFASTQFAAVISEHTLKVEIPSDLSPVMVDIRRIAQVINNLIGNAVKYSPPHTTIQLSAKQIGKQVQIDVRDEGFGIKPEDRLRVFEAFQQLDTIGITQKSGAGLGLAICKGLIEAHNGKIWVADKPAPGTTISFTVSCMDSDNMAYAAN